MEKRNTQPPAPDRRSLYATYAAASKSFWDACQDPNPERLQQMMQWAADLKHGKPRAKL